MSALLTLAACAMGPWLACQAVRGWIGVGAEAGEAERTRALGRGKHAIFLASVFGLPAAAVAGALFVDPVLSDRWPAAGSCLFAGMCAVTAWSSLALAQRSAEEAAAMPALAVIGRVVQMLSVPAFAVALSVAGTVAVDLFVPLIPAARAVLSALLSVASLLLVSPWLAMQLGLWRILPLRLEARGVSWRLAHLPVPHPFLTHAAALPWLHTVVLTDGLLKRAPEAQWQALVRYEIGSSGQSRSEWGARWFVAVSLSSVLFIAASAIGEGDPRKLLAATILAVFFTGAASWFANRQPASTLSLDADGPSMQELAQTLRSLPRSKGQALPRTSHRPVGGALYDRLFALGHDPGPRPGA